jgi:very-short-patch-repair endonuclease
MNTKRSESMKKAHAEGRHPGWSFINSDPTRMSYPEKYIKKCLLDAGYFDKYQIIPHLKYKSYFLDFAFIDLKLDLEIDGIRVRL